jgi:flagellar biosynthesis/type III secretory pathway protein FliH
MSQGHVVRGLEAAPDSVVGKALEVSEFREGSVMLAPKPPLWGGEPSRTWRPLGNILAKPTGPSPEELASQQDMAVGTVFKQAYDEGVKAARDTVGTLMERYHQVIAELEVLREKIIDDTQEDLAELAIKIAREAVLSDGDAREAFTFKMMDHCLELLKDADKITFKVSSTDMAALSKKHPELLEPGGVVKIVEDRRLNLGGVVAESEMGRIDASIEKRIEEIAAKIRRDLQDEDSPRDPIQEMKQLMDDEGQA